MDSKDKTEGGISDGASIDVVAVELKKCSDSWEPKARLLGNVRAEDISRLCASVKVDPIKFAIWFSKNNYKWHHGGWYKGGTSASRIRSDEQLIEKFIEDAKRNSDKGLQANS